MLKSQGDIVFPKDSAFTIPIFANISQTLTEDSEIRFHKARSLGHIGEAFEGFIDVHRQYAFEAFRSLCMIYPITLGH